MSASPVRRRSALGGPHARSALLGGLSSTDHRLSYAAIAGLAKLVDPELNRSLQERLADPTLRAEAKQRIIAVWSDRNDRAALL